MGANTTAITKNIQEYGGCPLAANVDVVAAYVRNSASETNIRVPIPDHCNLNSVLAVVTETIDGTASAVDIEKTSAGGTVLCSLSLTASGAVGTEISGTMAVGVADRNLDNDYLNIEVDGSASAAGAAMIYFILEPKYTNA